MPAALEADLRQWDGRDRSPHPYARKGSVSQTIYTDVPHRRAVNNHDDEQAHDMIGYSTPTVPEDVGSWEAEACASHTTSSESATEADDESERTGPLLKALPAPLLRPRKGLKGQALGGTSPLLTPAQLDRDDLRTLQGYFEAREGNAKPSIRNKSESTACEEDVVAARGLFEKRRTAERVRRISEAALLAIIAFSVISQHSVKAHIWTWHRELLSQIFAVAFLISVYPLRVVSREHLDVIGPLEPKSILHRFRVPASFDPASVLYPTFLPVLVALSLLPQFPALLLPNLILGLASLPPRLFPATSRLVDINTVGWMVAIVPLIISENTEFTTQRLLSTPYMLKAQGEPFLRPETLVLLYPLHQILLPCLHHLTATSLLPAEKHMLATGLANLLCFATSPQASILRALLWKGGVGVLVSCTGVLTWNVAIARVPSWRFRRSSSTKRSPFGNIILAFRDVILPVRSHDQGDSDADEDINSSPRCELALPSQATLQRPQAVGDTQEPKSAVEASPHGTLEFISGFTSTERKRRHTIPTVDDPTSFFKFRRVASGKVKQRKTRSWYLDLTSEGAVLRKWLYAIWVYAAIILIVLLPIRVSISRDALKGAEPITWAIDYLLEDVIAIFYSSTTLVEYINAYTSSLRAAASIYLLWGQLSVPAMRMAIGEANTRLLLAAYWLVVIAVGIATVTVLAPRIEVDTRRKIFHATIVTMLLPTTFIDPCFCALALSLVLAIFLILEVIRAGQVPPLGAAIGRFVAPYVDGRDLRGPMVVSHVFLLIGCAIPLWLSLSGLGRSVEGRWSGWEIQDDTREVGMIAGIVCVGMGDAAASLIGRRYGRNKWPWIGGKSLEGSAAFAFAVMIGLMAAKVWLQSGGWQEEMSQRASGESPEGAEYWLLQAGKALICGCGASFMEAVLTGANDNVVVPIALWLLVRGARI